ncbi:leucine-rich repeat-containing protein 15-like isoform X3 [Octopus sinensis]|uniref:Leucine-rich repeat-containing protein 15-like isoform X3 n=1 Tax=Octopus sinensis TaxID=2607531 RepID=A0A7E6FQU1_9MOLL|nr:leucine-rich repeat-containing protein 15-like isoform X3 [Octopus sinensis]
MYKSTPGNMFHHVVSYRRSLVLILCTILFLETQADSDICKICTCNSLTTRINCARRNLLSIPQPIPTNVEYLYLQWNNIETIKEGAFTGLSNLKELVLGANNIETIKEGAFTGLSNLKELDLSKNKISTIKDGTFKGLSNLKELNLGNNKISRIEKEMFQGLHNLEELDLSKNKISTIKDGTFKGLSNLKELYLRWNNISTIKEGVFTGLSNLETLRLSNNKISRIEKEMFQGLHNLEKLYLSNNKISRIEKELFQGLHNLEKLYLDNDNIATIKEGAFTGLSNLKELRLSYNKISRIEKEMFEGLHNLEKLYLNSNPIEKYEDGAFLFLPSIVKIYLEYNKLMKCGCHLPAFVKYIKEVYNRTVAVFGTCLEGSGKRIPILDYSQCQNYSLFQRNLQCQTCSGIICNEEVTSCPGTEPVCRFAISMNGAKLKTERSCSTYRKCVEAMRNNTLTCNKRTNGTSCTGCCVGHLCNKNDFIGWTKSLVFRLIFKKFNEYKIPAENISRAIEHDLSTVTGTFRVEDCG